MAPARGFEPRHRSHGLSDFKSDPFSHLGYAGTLESRDILRGLPASSTGLCLNRSGTIIIIVKAVKRFSSVIVYILLYLPYNYIISNIFYKFNFFINSRTLLRSSSEISTLSGATTFS